MELYNQYERKCGKMFTDITLIFFTLYGAYSFAVNAFAYAESISQPIEHKPKIRLEKAIYSPEVEKIINKYTGKAV